jgi:endonuclease/exonuclease/phosphatase family metal-dependent hydrolase
MAFSLCTFNVNNLYTRYRFGKKIPGEKPHKDQPVETEHAHPFTVSPRLFEPLGQAKRILAAEAITGDMGRFPDILCLQEVESLPALRRFNEDYLKAAYSYAFLVESHDARRIHTGVLSKSPLRRIRSHLDIPDRRGTFLFPRDCLEIEVKADTGQGETLTLLVNHFKSGLEKEDSASKEATSLRERQAEGVVEILRERFPGPAFDTGLFAVIGDLNDHLDSGSLRPLTRESGLVDALGRIHDQRERWTYWLRKKNSVFPYDHILLSPRLDEISQLSRPRIERRGIGFRRYVKKKLQGPKRVYLCQPGRDEPGRVDFQFDRFPQVTPKVEASDHCPVFFSF